MEKRNKKGQTLIEFLDEYKNLGYPEEAETVDSILFAVDTQAVVLLVKRGDFPDIGDYAFPGGFLEKGEDIESAARRELSEETGMTPEILEPLCVVSTAGRDPRAEITTHCFMGIISEPEVPVAGDDADEARWFTFDYAAKGDIYELVLKSGDIVLNAVMRVVRDENGKVDIDKTEILSRDGIAFDHAKLILYAVETL
jgi:ADP-ribose pyrophosphatase YjhB (NUDIX family)